MYRSYNHNQNLKIIQLLADDYRVKEIARRLKLSKSCVEQRLQYMRLKLNLSSSTALVAYYLRNGLIE